MKQVKARKLGHYVADLSQLDTIDSSGLGVLISIRNAAIGANGTFRVEARAAR